VILARIRLPILGSAQTPRKWISLGFLIVVVVETHDHYFGIPTYIGRLKKMAFKAILDWVKKKLNCWKENFF